MEKKMEKKAKMTKAERWFGARFKDLSAEQKVLYQRKVSAECYEKNKEAKKQAVKQRRAEARAKLDEMAGLIAQVRELQAEVARLKRAGVRECTYGDLAAGDTFMFKGHEFTKLRDGRAIINSYYVQFMKCIFDNVNNYYNDSLIRHYINGKFLDLLGLEMEDFGPYGVECTLLTREEYEENKDLIKGFEGSWWLYPDYGITTDSAYLVLTSGGFTYDYISNSYGVRPAFNFGEGIKVQVANDN